MYFYIIFPYGFNKLEEITNMLQQKFDIFKSIQIKIHESELNNFFFNYLYIEEPKNHITEKIKHLVNDVSNSEFEIKVFLIKDKNEVFFNDRGTLKNKNIEMMKRDIRNKFNPKFDDINKEIFPLNKGVSHNHIIHSNDVPSEFKIIKNIILRFKKYNIFKFDKYHFKNDFFLNYFINKHHKHVYNIEEADIVLSADTAIYDTYKYPYTKFIFGPHFGKGRINEIKKLNNSKNNNMYIQPSLPSVKLWTDEYNFNSIPIKAIPFGVDTERFIGNEQSQRNNVILYYKSREPNELKLLTTFLNNKKINYKIFNYQKRYNENEFLSYLKTCKFGIVLGRHESQGFAIQEMLSCNVPLLIWGVTLRNQQYPYEKSLQNIKTPVSTVPYWSSDCGELFYDYSELENKYNTFINNLDKYKPRQFIIENLSLDACCNKWNELLFNF